MSHTGSSPRDEVLMCHFISIQLERYQKFPRGWWLMQWNEDEIPTFTVWLWVSPPPPWGNLPICDLGLKTPSSVPPPALWSWRRMVKHFLNYKVLHKCKLLLFLFCLIIYFVEEFPGLLKPCSPIPTAELHAAFWLMADLSPWGALLDFRRQVENCLG